MEELEKTDDWRLLKPRRYLADKRSQSANELAIKIQSGIDDQIL